jgi:2-keto-4-pentenoate hydratase/2-oxohepta-3-ene-1,7-dioic acid hydratase in catechol pathway
MRLVAYAKDGRNGVAIATESGEWRGAVAGGAGYPGTIAELVAAGTLDSAKSLLNAAPVSLDEVEVLPPLPNPGKIICLGLNYSDHAAESGFEAPPFPTVFARFPSSLVGAYAPIVKPALSDALDWEAELVAVIGKGGRHIRKADALSHVAGYSVFNDASVRDYQRMTPQWTVGKNFDGTGAFGPALVTSDELPEGASGLKIECRVNGEVMQSDTTDHMIFDVATTIELLSRCFALVPGDVLVMGTPAGVGLARTPPLYMKVGDVCEVEIEKVGLLRNRIIAE